MEQIERDTSHDAKAPPPAAAPEVTHVTYMPLPDDPEETTLGGIRFRAYEPVELDSSDSRHVTAAALAPGNKWFTGGEVDADRKAEWEKVRDVRKEEAARQLAYARATRVSADNNALVRPDAVEFDPERAAVMGTHTGHTAAEIENARLMREAELNDPDRGDLIVPMVNMDVWYWPAYNPNTPPVPNQQPFAAKIACVWGDRKVNLHVINHDGASFAAREVQLLQGDDLVPRNAYCAWMPYQKGQAAKAAKAEPVTSGPIGSGGVVDHHPV